MRELFGGRSRREKISLAREFEWLQRKVLSGESFSECIQFYMGAGMAVGCPSGLSATHIALYGSHEMGGVQRPIYDKDGTHLVVSAQADGIVILPADIFPVGYIYLALASDSDGTLTTEQSDFDFMVMIKP